MAALRAAAAPGPGRTAVGGLADLLAPSGLTMEVTGPRGTIASLGNGVDSRLGKLVAGSRHVRLGSVRTVLPLAAAQIRGQAPSARRVGPLLAAAAVIALMGRAGRR